MLKLGFLQGAAVYTTFSYSDDVLIKYADAVNIVFSKISSAIQTGNSIKSLLNGPVRSSGFARLS